VLKADSWQRIVRWSKQQKSPDLKGPGLHALAAEAASVEDHAAITATRQE
jgi:hypothetical protein